MSNTKSNTKTVKPVVFSERDVAIVNLLINAPEGGLTLAEISAEYNANKAPIEPVTPILPGHIVSLMKKGVVAPIGEKQITKMVNTKVSTYHFATAELMTDKNGKAFNYTDKEKALMPVLAKMADSFTLADLGNALGVEKLSSGSINGLVKKGNIVKGESIVVAKPRVTSVNVYGATANALDKINASNSATTNA